jgi:predicted house-cleaning noncanonical NTP pyrophosphatase (MazG superfamily)
MKLVRDRIPGLAAANGQPGGGFHQADLEEFSRRLRDKLLEEAHEATTPGRAAGGAR